MELNMMIAILPRRKQRVLQLILRRENVKSITMLARGTADKEHLTLYGLQQSEKVVVSAFATGEKSKRLMKEAERGLSIDVPGNGIMFTVPIKSVGGGKVLEHLTDGAAGSVDKETPDLSFDHELVYIIYNEGNSDLVLSAARGAGAKGGTILTARGTGISPAERFLGLSFANEKEVLLIVMKSDKKAAVMKAVMEKAGKGSKADAVCFSLPVTQVEGIRRLDD